MSATGDGGPRACPRCQQPLEQAELRKVSVEACKGCQGTAVPQRELARLLEGLSGLLRRSFDADAEIPKVNDPDGRIACPTCRGAMDRDDYCAAGVVFFDRCNGCALLWFDADELGAMALMWGRMNARQAQAIADRRHATREANRLDRGVLRYAVWGSLMF